MFKKKAVQLKLHHNHFASLVKANSGKKFSSISNLVMASCHISHV